MGTRAKVTTAPVPASRQKQDNGAKANEGIRKNKAQAANKPKTVPAKIRLEVFKRDQCCQWVETVKNNKGEQIKRKCESRFQLQVDHIKPRWQDGSNSLENLQLLCAVHNKRKYRNEILGKANQLEESKSTIKQIDRDFNLLNSKNSLFSHNQRSF